MKLNQREIELKILNTIVNVDNAVFIAAEKSIKEYHFLSKDPGIKGCLTGKFYKIAQDYATQSGGSKLTEVVLESFLLKSGKEEAIRNKFANLWLEVQNEETSFDEFSHLISLLKERYSIKLMSEMVDQIADHVNNDQARDAITTISTYVNTMHEELDDFQKDKVSFDMSLASDFFLKEYDERAMNPDLFKGVNCGFSQIDEKTFGFMPSQLVVLLAPSSGGKSVQLLNWADHAHRVCKKNVLYFSFEMSEWLCKLRHASLVAEVDYSHIKSTSMTPAERTLVEKNLKTLNNGKYFEYVEALEDPTPEFIEQKIREMSASKGQPEYIVADYIGNMHSRSTSKNAKHWEKNGDAAEGLFKIAKRYNVPVITAQQINRESIKENRKRKEDGKSAAYYQDAASGDQRLMHLSTYVIGMEPNREDSICFYHPVKMRDAWFTPFAAKWIPEYNKVVEMNEAQQAALMALKSADMDSAGDYEKPSVKYDTAEIDLSDWINDF